jgi:flagella basal body P-ring formation protein FlgA
MVAVFLLFISSYCTANNQTPDLNSQISAFLDHYSQELAAKGYRSEYRIDRIDPRLSTGECDKELDLSFNRQPTEQSRVTIAVECDGNKPWRIFVNTDFHIFGLTVVTNQSIARGSRITASMLSSKEQIVNQGRYNTYSSVKDVIGMLAKRSIRSGVAVTPNVLKAPSLVKRGDRVVIIAANDAISVKMNGTALADGVRGEQIPIQNNQSKRIVKAEVIDNGRVLIAL